MSVLWLNIFDYRKLSRSLSHPLFHPLFLHRSRNSWTSFSNFHGLCTMDGASGTHLMLQATTPTTISECQHLSNFVNFHLILPHLLWRFSVSNLILRAWTTTTRNFISTIQLLWFKDLYSQFFVCTSISCLFERSLSLSVCLCQFILYFSSTFLYVVLKANITEIVSH